ncbi:uncharacterized protein LOC116010359 [Ipomoea triloba]|uniref:uncharacterized protein LOC116010359 n=1 Tax=Ipomoea triloba TaxID=35885 RepID=UPI00125E9054|nr:uncharacterized protein LOC116010359 [Ipomoea triloba]
MSQSPTPNLIKLERKLRAELDDALTQEEMIWYQRSREEWLISGDRNTRYYHTATSVNKNRTRVEKLKTDEGIWLTDSDLLLKHIQEHFIALFSEDQTRNSQISALGHYPTLTDQDWQLVNSPFRLEEIKQALFDMDPCKAPGPDGFTAGFYQKAWDIVGKDLINFALNFFETGTLPPGTNDTIITLIPKTANPETVKQLRPIGLCNVVYKLVSKTMASRLQEISKKLVGHHQTSFVPGRQIADNIVVFQEVLNSMRIRKAKVGWMIMKIDLEKAYDKLAWSFIEESLSEIGFNTSWRRNILECITTSRLAINWEGKLSEWFNPTRGIRQGDPLSPLLFVLCVERFSHLILDSVNSGRWKGIKISRQGPHITHLFFADDMMLFGEATIEQAEEMTRCLEIFCEQSGQRMNIQKSALYFSKRTLEELQQNIASLTRIPKVEDLGRYLGVPSIHGRLKKESFTGIIERMHQKLAGWRSKTLSLAGRIVLAQSVLSAIPYYSMQTTMLPIGVIKEMEQLIRNFIWGSSPSIRRCHLVNWNTVTKSKFEGGLGLRKLDKMNEAFLAKLGWRLMQNEDSLWTQVLKAKYAITSVDCMTWRPKANMSFVWKGILNTIPILQGGRVKLINNGQSTQFWTDRWVGLSPLINKATSMISLWDRYRTVDSYWKENQGWDWEELQDYLPETSLNELAAIIIDDNTEIADSFGWKYGTSEVFSVCAAYDLATNHSTTMETAKWNAIWSLKLPNRIKLFLWLTRHERIMTNSLRATKGMTEDTNCWLCRDEEENTEHVLRKCPAADAIWSRLLPSLYWQTRNLSFTDWLDRGIAGKGNQRRPDNENILFAVAVWWIWKWRNDAIFNNCTQPLRSKMEWIKSQTQEIYTTLSKGKSQIVTLNAYKWEELRWSKPPEEMTKINFDGSVEIASGKAACGGIARDCKGTWMGGFTHTIGICSPLQAEAWGLLKSIQLANFMGYRRVIFEGDANFMGYRRVIFEGDSHELISIFNEGEGDSHELISIFNEGSASIGAVCNIIRACRQEIGAVCNIIRACRQELAKLHKWEINVIPREVNAPADYLNVIPREVNAPADYLARKAREHPRGFKHLVEPPAEILELIESDCAGFPYWRLMFHAN